MIYVQHLLGIGHLQRAMQLAEALARQGFAVELVSGGSVPQHLHIDGVDITRLAPLRSKDASFTQLLDGDGKAIDEAFRQGRREQLLQRFNAYAPDLLITETFPFGRRMMRFELLPLLQAAKAVSRRVMLVCSIRDILQPKSKVGRNEEICALLDEYYDHVLIHGDPGIARLQDSFALASRIEDKVCYSGYIARRSPVLVDSDENSAEVLVSAGGSATGLHILKTAIAAKPLSSLASHRWRVLVSPAIDTHQFEELRALADDTVVVERNIPDFPQRLRRASLSISQAGYNTVTDLLQTRTPACLIPFAGGSEVEQQLRARRLQQLGRVIVLEEADLSPENLAAVIDQALQLKQSLPEINLDGARHSAEIIEAWLAQPA